MAKPADRLRSREGKPHHIHALTKASATHLHKMGHITEDQHDEIVDHAEKHMKKARRSKD